MSSPPSSLAPRRPLPDSVLQNGSFTAPESVAPIVVAANERRAGRVAAWQATVPAVLLFALGVAAQQAPLSRPLKTAEVERVASIVAAGVVENGETMLVSAKSVSGSSLLRGRLQFSDGVSGRAPLSGQVARVLVRQGQFVQVNDRVLQISTSTGSRIVPRVERRQSSAESAQVEAVGAQTALQNKLAQAQIRLVAARERVARAGTRVAQAQDIVQKLQRGETVSIPDAEGASANRNASSRRARRQATRRRSERRERRDSGANRDAINQAMRESQSARRASDAAQAEVESARRAAEEADSAAGTKTQQIAEARAALESAQKRLADATAKAADAEAAKTAVADAENAAAEARSRMAEARKNVAVKESAAASLRAAADKAAAEAARAARKLQLFASPTDASPDESAADSTAGADTSEKESGAQSDAGVSSVARAARLVEAALQESSEAIREARHLKSDVEKYDRQVKSTSRRLDDTGKELQAAQQTVLDNMIRTRLSSVRAPSSGTVLSIAELASEVSEGQSIITIGHSNVLRVRFADYSGAWKRLQPGALLTAVVQPSLEASSAAPAVRFRATGQSGANGNAARRAASSQRASTLKTPNREKQSRSSDATNPVASPAVANPAVVKKAVEKNSGVPIVARLRSVQAPERPGQPAIMEAVIFNPRRLIETPNGLHRRRVFRPGMAILCSIDRPGKRRVINVPGAAVLRDDAGSNRGLIAVLTPAPISSPAPSSEATPEVASARRFSTPSTAAPDAATNAQSQLESLADFEAEAPSIEMPPVSAGLWHRIEMRSVVLGRNDGVQQEILSGLREGERISLQPAMLRTWTSKIGSRAAVRVQTEKDLAPSL